MSFVRRLFSATCQVGMVGVVGGAVMYHYEYGNMRTDTASTDHSLTTFSKDTRRGIYDVAIVGGGIVGVATAREIRQKFPKLKVILVEREADVAQHQSGHNSGCIHAGMFYKPGSAMARLCPRGHNMMVEYCKKNNLPYELNGKLIVAANDAQTPIVQQLYEWGTANGVKGLQVLNNQDEIQKVEPQVVGVSALWSPVTGIIDFAEVTRHMFSELVRGGKGKFDSQFQFDAQDFVGVQTVNKSAKHMADPEEMVLIRGREQGQLGPEKTILARSVITCAGLNNDVVAKHSGSVLSLLGPKIAQTYSFRGRYYQLTPEKRDLVKAHVYPCPDNRRGMSVGVHFTPTVDVRRGRQVILGPGSAVALDRYGYSPYLINLEYCFHCAFSKGGWVSLFSNFDVILQTYYLDLSKKVFLRECQKLIPTVQAEDIEESFCGVMAIGVAQTGSLCMDLAMEFARPRTTIAAQVGPAVDVTATNEPVQETGRPLILNVRNAPSPAATASMAIAEDIVGAASAKFQWK